MHFFYKTIFVFSKLDIFFLSNFQFSKILFTTMKKSVVSIMLTNQFLDEPKLWLKMFSTFPFSFKNRIFSRWKMTKKKREWKRGQPTEKSVVSIMLTNWFFGIQKLWLKNGFPRFHSLLKIEIFPFEKKKSVETWTTNMHLFVHFLIQLNIFFNNYQVFLKMLLLMYYNSIWVL